MVTYPLTEAWIPLACPIPKSMLASHTCPTDPLSHLSCRVLRASLDQCFSCECSHKDYLPLLARRWCNSYCVMLCTHQVAKSQKYYFTLTPWSMPPSSYEAMEPMALSCIFLHGFFHSLVGPHQSPLHLPIFQESYQWDLLPFLQIQFHCRLCHSSQVARWLYTEAPRLGDAW